MAIFNCFTTPIDSLLGLSPAAVLGILALLLVVTSHVRSYLRLRHVPGPPGAALSKWWMLRNTVGGTMHIALKDACDRYGHLVRIGPNDLVTDDPDVLRRLWAVRSPYRKGSFYRAIRFDPKRDNLVSMRDDRLHGELRAKMASGYSGKDNEKLEPTIDAQILSFTRLLSSKYLSSCDGPGTDGRVFRPVDLARKLQYLTLDVITSLAFGERFGFVDEDRDVHRYIEMTEQNMPVMLVLGCLPKLAVALQSPFFRWLLPSEHDRLGFGKFIGVAKHVVAERLASSDVYRRDMLGSFLAHGLTREEAEGETLVQIIAGSDSVATVMRITMLFLMTSPRCYGALTEEIAAGIRAGTVPSVVDDGDDAVVTDAAARNMPYLQAVIKEGLRIWPPVVGLMGVEVPPGGDVIHGYHLPPGTEIGCALAGVMRSKAVFGEDADLFRPERWIEAAANDRDRHRKMIASWELAFKYGKWQCLGKTVALIELNKIFVELLRRFDFEIINPSEPVKSYSAGIFIQSDMWCHVTKSKRAELRATGSSEKA